MEHRDVLNQLVFLGLHIGENDMSVALTLTYKLNSATQQICVACRDAVVAPVLGEAKRRCEVVGYAEGPTVRRAVINVCSELFGPSFSKGSGLDDVMLLVIDKICKNVELAGEHTGQQSRSRGFNACAKVQHCHRRGLTFR
jgi:hypothetical protein